MKIEIYVWHLSFYNHCPGLLYGKEQSIYIPLFHNVIAINEIQFITMHGKLLDKYKKQVQHYTKNPVKP